MARRSLQSGATVSADLIRGLIDCAVACGVPRARLSDLVRQEAMARQQSASSARYSGALIFRLWERIDRLSNDPIVGFRMALAARLKTFGVLGQILPQAGTVLDAFRQTERYSAIASQAARVTIAARGEMLAATIEADVPANAPARNIMLWALTNLSLMPQRLTGSSVRPKLVECAFPSPGPAAARVLRAHFPVRFEAPANRLTFDRAVGTLRIPTADADLQSLLADVIERELARLGPSASFQQGIKAVLAGMINGTMPSIEAVSARAGLSKRTLQRRLLDAGTSFQGVLGDVLREIAEQHLADGRLTHSEIAFLLGYSEESAFSRAYRTWTGRPPSQFARADTQNP